MPGLNALWHSPAVRQDVISVGSAGRGHLGQALLSAPQPTIDYVEPADSGQGNELAASVQLVTRTSCLLR